jgi:hypothetical protein
MRTMHKNGAIAIALTTAIIVGGAGAFNFPNMFKLPTNPATATAAAAAARFVGKPKRRSLPNEEIRLLRALGGTGNGKNADAETRAHILSIVRGMETTASPSPTLLSDIDEATFLLDGDWFLRYTAPGGGGDDDEDDDDGYVAVDATEGGSKIATRRFGKAGRVSGGGIPVDASKNAAVQSFDVRASRVTNVITTRIGLVTVGGTYRASDAVPLRAVVAFDTAKIELDVGPTLDVSFLFDLRAAIKGSKEAGWLETTYVSGNVRIGRGNKGSMFVLTRDRDTTLPLS